MAIKGIYHKDVVKVEIDNSVSCLKYLKRAGLLNKCISSALHVKGFCLQPKFLLSLAYCSSQREVFSD